MCSPVDAIDGEEVAVARGGRDQLARPAVDHAVDEDRRLRRVPVVRVVRRRLVVPRHLAGIDVDRDERAREEVVALAARRPCSRASDCRCRRCRASSPDRRRRESRPGRRRGARRRGSATCRGRDRPASSARYRTSTAACRSPDRTTAGSPGASRSLPVPTSTWLPMTIGAIVEKYCWLKSAISTCQRSLPVLRVERDEVVVGRLEVQVVVPHRHAAAADVRAALRLPEVVPELAAVARVDRPDVVGRGDVEHAVDLQDRRP